MGFITSSSGSLASEESRINAIEYEQSTFGTAKSVVYGTNRICGNLIDNVDFTAKKHKSSVSVGKGGGSTDSVTYTYNSRIVLGLCYGEINGIKKILFDDGTYSLDDLNLTFFNGSDTQSAWGEMTSKHPTHALCYRNLAYVAGYVDLTTSGGVPQYNFEIMGKFTDNTDDIDPIITEGFSFDTDEGYLGTCTAEMDYNDYYVSLYYIEVIYYDKNGMCHTVSNFQNYKKSGSTLTFYLSSYNAVSATCYFTYNSTVRLDANPKDIMLDILTNSLYGAGFSSDYIDADSFSDFSDYCIANNIFLSPVYDTQEEAQSVLTDLAEICNSTFVWSQGLLRITPLGDEEVTDNGKTWTPDLTPIYDLTSDDFLDDDEPVTCTRTDMSDVYNSVKLEFKNRANEYNVEVAEAQDLAHIELYGLRAADTQTAHQICTAEIAQRTAQLALERNIAVRNSYTFKLPLKYILLEPMDLVTLTYERLGLERELVRIKKITESDNQLEIEAEECVTGTATPAKIQTQRASMSVVDTNQSIGDVNAPIIFEPPFSLTSDTMEVWLGVSSSNNLFGGCQIYISDDNSTFKYKDDINTQIRQGVLTESLPYASESPDTENVLSVDLSMSESELVSGTLSDAENLNTLCYVDGELLAFQEAELTDDYAYDLSYLVRGAYNSETSEHAAGADFARIDEDMFYKYPFSQEDIGKTIYIKLPTYNTFGGGLQSLANVEVYSYTILGTGLQEAPEDVTGLTSYYSDNVVILTWDAVDDTRSILYEVRKGGSWTDGQTLTRTSGNRFITCGNGTYYVKALVSGYDVYSENAAAIEIAGSRIVQNLIEDIDIHSLGYPGTMTTGLYVNSEGNLCAGGIGLFSEIELLSDVESVRYFGGMLQYGEYEYSGIVDIGVAASCYIYCDYNFFGEDAYSSIDVDDIAKYVNGKVQIAVAEDEDFGEWQDLVEGLYYARQFKFRAVLISSSEDVAVSMDVFTVYVDVPDIVDTGTNITVAEGGSHIDFEEYFHATPNLQVTILDKNQNDDEFITNLNSSGFDICLKNDGEYISKTINYIAQGY